MVGIADCNAILSLVLLLGCMTSAGRQLAFSDHAAPDKSHDPQIQTAKKSQDFPEIM